MFIPRAMKAVIEKTLRQQHIEEDSPLFAAMMALVAPEAVSERQWVYPANGEPRIVSAAEAKELCATSDYSDHPDGHIIESDESNKLTRSWGKVKGAVTVEGGSKTDGAIVFTAENGDTVFVRDAEGNPVGDPKFMEPLTEKAKKDDLIARAVGVGVDPKDDSVKKDIVALIDAKRVAVVSVTELTLANTTEEIMAAAKDLCVVIPTDASKQEAVDLVNKTRAAN